MLIEFIVIEKKIILAIVWCYQGVWQLLCVPNTYARAPVRPWVMTRLSGMCS